MAKSDPKAAKNLTLDRFASVKRAYAETMPIGTDPSVVIPKICEVIGKSYPVG